MLNIDPCASASIVGGMIGALVGIRAMPERMWDSVMRFDCAKAQRPRGERLNLQKNAIPSIEALIAARPVRRLMVIEKRWR